MDKLKMDYQNVIKLLDSKITIKKEENTNMQKEKDLKEKYRNIPLFSSLM